MSGVMFLVPLSLVMGLIALAAFFWALRSGQYHDMDGDGARVLLTMPEDGDAGARREGGNGS